MSDDLYAKSYSWLVENTTLTFKQIAEFCNLHELEVKGILMVMLLGELKLIIQF